jgi:hypothetical protein
MSAPFPASAPTEPTTQRLVAWVDGVGAFLLCLGDTATLGGLSGRSDIRLAADLAPRHATIVRSGERYVVEATEPALVAREGRAVGVSPASRASGRVVQGRTDLNDGEELLLYREGSSGVRLRFRQPNVLTATAALAVASDHRTEPRYDGIVLLADACVLGPRRDAHIVCRGWEETLLLFRRDGQLWCKSPVPLAIDGTPAGGSAPVEAGSHVTGDGISFRLEAL